MVFNRLMQTPERSRIKGRLMPPPAFARRQVPGMLPLEPKLANKAKRDSEIIRNLLLSQRPRLIQRNYTLAKIQ